MLAAWRVLPSQSFKQTAARNIRRCTPLICEAAEINNSSATPSMVKSPQLNAVFNAIPPSMLRILEI